MCIENGYFMLVGKFKKIASFLLVFFVFFLNFAINTKAEDVLEKIKSNKKIKMLTNAEFPPFEFFDEKQNIKGIDIDICEKIAEKLGVELVKESVSFDSLLIEIQNKNCDFSAAAMTYSEEKAKNVLFSESYFKSSQKIIVLKDSEISSKENLKGKKIGVGLGTTGDTFCSNQKEFLEPIRFSNPIDSIQDLLNSNLDAIVIDDFTADNIINSRKDKLKKLDETLTSEDYVIIAPKGSEALINVINEVLYELKNSKEIDKIIQKYKEEKILFVTKSNDEENIYNKFFSIVITGVQNTVFLTLFSVFLGIILGIILAILRASSCENKKFKILSFFAKVYVTVVRGTPVLVQVFLMCYVIFPIFGISNKFVAAVIAFGMNSAAYVAEIIRSGIKSISKGQLEASRSLGINYKDSMIYIILPQALKNVLPALINELIGVLKETSVVGMIGLVDLVRAGDIIRSTTYDAFMPLMLVATIYLTIVLLLTWVLSIVEKRIKKNDIS